MGAHPSHAYGRAIPQNIEGTEVHVGKIAGLGWGRALGSAYHNLQPQGTPVLSASALPENKAMHAYFFFCSRRPRFASGCKPTSCFEACTVTCAQRELVPSPSHGKQVCCREVCHFCERVSEFSPRPLTAICFCTCCLLQGKGLQPSERVAMTTTGRAVSWHTNEEQKVQHGR